jgi:hypothetical protein
MQLRRHPHVETAFVRLVGRPARGPAHRQVVLDGLPESPLQPVDVAAFEGRVPDGKGQTFDTNSPNRVSMRMTSPSDMYSGT